MPINGRWRITEMELWDLDAIELLGPALFELGPGNNGRFRFIAVEGFMDVRPATRDGSPAFEFSWEGSDEGDQMSGRGWAVLTADGSLSGRIYFHNGDDSSFRAEPTGF
jgi:hypothetical protein